MKYQMTVQFHSESQISISKPKTSQTAMYTLTKNDTTNNTNLADTDHEDGEENHFDKVDLQYPPQDGGDLRPHLATLVPHGQDVELHLLPQSWQNVTTDSEQSPGKKLQ